MTFADLILAGGIVLVISILMTRLMMLLNISDVPNARSSHAIPTPKSGGVAIAVAFLVGLALFYSFQDNPTELLDITPNQFVLYAGLTVFIVLAALVDDLWEILPFSKMAAQFLSALFFAVFIARIDTVYLLGLGYVDLGVFGCLLTILWIIFFMNAFNFMDGINGIAGGGAVIAAIFLGLTAMGAQSYFVALCCACVIAAIPGFLIFNFPGGHIFMGDTGSQFLGFLFASLAVFGNSLDEGQLSIYIVPVLFYPFIFDVLVTLLYRALRKENVLHAHREHLYQIATKLGASHVVVTVAYCVLFVVTGIAAVNIQLSEPSKRVLSIIMFLPFFGFLATLVYRVAVKKGVAPPWRLPERFRQTQ